ncbi:MAG: uncharacterized protein PWR32_777 [Candidatus Woesearchaeota archaeon]|nr:uncharacterized protein [Candidatus Woesearchaeota archaeon]
MIKIKFFGHKNILGLHFNTFEFTKDSFVTKKGDCIIGVNSEFDFSNLTQFLDNQKKVKVKGLIVVYLNGQRFEDTFEGLLNKNFDINSRELVFRKSDFDSKRTLVVRCNKSAKQLNRRMIDALKSPEAQGECLLEFETVE